MTDRNLKKMAVNYCINTCSLPMKTVINSTCIESHVLNQLWSK